MGDYVVVINAKDVALTGKKSTQKEYMWHSGYPGGQTVLKFDKFIERHPTEPLKKAVWGMMPKGNLRKEQIHRLKLFAGSDHPYASNIVKSYIPEPVVAVKTETVADNSALQASLPPPVKIKFGKRAKK
ncbi:ribosomal protein L13, variant [Batrachochytrium dendrobatidis JEL423]|nr:ribosomal protein L13, variant [Batrachochytrium dendrobatidis JEL423]